MKRLLKEKVAVIIFVPITILLNMILKNYPDFVEKYYSKTINKFVREKLSLITSLFSFSAAEFLAIFLVIILLYLIILLIIKIKQGRLLIELLNLGLYLSVLYILFMVLWGFNYDRLPLNKILGITIEKSSEQELNFLCEDLIDRANILRSNLKEDSQGVMMISGGYKSVFNRSAKGYEKASLIYPELGGEYGIPKPILLSEKMSYTGITGIYMPYTGEANVNINQTDLMLPCTAAHEMAHQRGYAREDEANYIAYLTCSMHPDLDFQYSGVMLALINAMNALGKEDIEAYKLLKVKYSQGVLRDLQYESKFWSKYAGNVERISNNVNDNYLKSNGQKDGVESYGRMVDLLLAEYKHKKL